MALSRTIGGILGFSMVLLTALAGCTAQGAEEEGEAEQALVLPKPPTSEQKPPGAGLTCTNATEEVDGCSRTLILPTAKWVDEHNARMNAMIGKVGIEPNPSSYGCFAHYEKGYSTRSVTKNVLMGSAGTVAATKLVNGWETKPLLKKCDGICEDIGATATVYTPNVANVVDCAGKAVGAAAAVYEVVKTWNEIHDNGCLVQVKNYHRELEVVEAKGCETTCTLESNHACNSCGGVEADRTNKTLKSADLKRKDSFFQHDTFVRAACTAEAVPQGDPQSPDYKACGDCTGYVCIKASCGNTKPTYTCARDLPCWNNLQCEEAARMLACTAMAGATCKTLNAGAP